MMQLQYKLYKRCNNITSKQKETGILLNYLLHCLGCSIVNYTVIYK